MNKIMNVKNFFIVKRNVANLLKSIIISVFCFLVFILPINVKAAYDVEYHNVTEICSLVYMGYNRGVNGPIIITKGLYQNGENIKEIYLVTLSGTEIIHGQSTGYYTDILSGLNLDNPYQRNVVRAIQEYVPKNSNLIFAGHSLGGMIAQQVVANESIKNDYNVMNTICFGSPLLSAGKREGIVNRLADKSDVVPYLSGSLINNTKRALREIQKEDGGYKNRPLDAHSQSYFRTDLWGNYDVTGVKGGQAIIKLDTSTRRYFKSPTKW